MCRLYGFCATEPTKVECTLVHSQNALVTQSRADLAGEGHPDGWGIAAYDDGQPRVERQTWAAYHGEHFRRTASRVHARLVIAHVRGATVGASSLENTHPFTWRNWAFAHNGTIQNFERIRPRLLAGMSDELRSCIRGETDSEHVFYYVLSMIHSTPAAELPEVIHTAVRDIDNWSREVDPRKPASVNLIITDGKQIAGTRLGRSLHFVKRSGILDCEICGFPHIHHHPRANYRAFVVASEPLTDEHWSEMPERSTWSVDSECTTLSVQPFQP
jgi:glutamine amidotransferase